ncbi:MAG: hypothetical protein WAL91_05065 [Propionicimonas sp.]
MPGESQRQRMRQAQLANKRAARWRRLALYAGVGLAAVLVAVLVWLLLPR